MAVAIVIVDACLWGGPWRMALRQAAESRWTGRLAGNSCASISGCRQALEQQACSNARLCWYKTSKTGRITMPTGRGAGIMVLRDALQDAGARFLSRALFAAAVPASGLYLACIAITLAQATMAAVLLRKSDRAASGPVVAN